MRTCDMDRKMGCESYGLLHISSGGIIAGDALISDCVCVCVYFLTIFVLKSLVSKLLELL
jgi:hypothetical protein